MFLFDLLFGRKKSAPEARGALTPQPPAPRAPEADSSQASAPGTVIHHDPHLIDALKADHRLLFDIYGEIDTARRAHDLPAIQTRLEHFRRILQGHLLKENVRLYVFLEHTLAGAPANHQLMRGFRHEMDDIGRAVVGFLDRYREIGAHPELAAEFSTDFQAIGEALTARITREENTLYPMYAPLA